MPTIYKEIIPQTDKDSPPTIETPYLPGDKITVKINDQDVWNGTVLHARPVYRQHRWLWVIGFSSTARNESERLKRCPRCGVRKEYNLKNFTNVRTAKNGESLRLSFHCNDCNATRWRELGAIGYYSYRSAMMRCRNEKNKQFLNYGGRGIQFKFTSFKQFLQCVGNRPTKKHSLDRIDNNGHYESGNVRWATSTEQARNKRVTVFNVNLVRLLRRLYHEHNFSRCELAKMFQISKSTLQNVLNYNSWSSDGPEIANKRIRKKTNPAADSAA